MSRNPRPPSPTLKLYVTSSGPIKGEPECIAAFQTKDDAVRFLSDLHGLQLDEGRRLRREMRLALKRRLHGADRCAIQVETMTPFLANLALSGELYL